MPSKSLQLEHWDSESWCSILLREGKGEKKNILKYDLLFLFSMLNIFNQLGLQDKDFVNGSVEGGQ